MTSFENVETLNKDGFSVCEIAIDLHKWAEEGHALDVVVIHRDEDGALAINYSLQSTPDVCEIASYLNAYAQRLVWNANAEPDFEKDQKC